MQVLGGKHKSRFGRIDEDDFSDRPYTVRFVDGETSRFRESQVTEVSEDEKTAGQRRELAARRQGSVRPSRSGGSSSGDAAAAAVLYAQKAEREAKAGAEAKVRQVTADADRRVAKASKARAKAEAGEQRAAKEAQKATDQAKIEADKAARAKTALGKQALQTAAPPAAPVQATGLRTWFDAYLVISRKYSCSAVTINHVAGQPEFQELKAKGEELNRLWSLVARGQPALGLSDFLTFCTLVDGFCRFETRYDRIDEAIMQSSLKFARHMEKLCSAQTSFGLLYLTPTGDGPGDVPESITYHSGARGSLVWQALAEMLQTDSRKLKRKGKDPAHRGHSRLQLRAAWRIDNPNARQGYEGAFTKTVSECNQIVSQDKWPEHGNAALTVATRNVASGLIARLPTPPRDTVSEAIMLQGIKPEVILSCVNTGLNPNLSGSGAGTAFGEGVYLAEDAGKADQYVEGEHADDKFNAHPELHAHLYGRSQRHPCCPVYYLLVCRVVLGCSIRTQVHGKDATSMDTGERLFPINFRELATVPGVSPTVFHHSLVAELGRSIDRYREFVVYHREQVRSA